MILSLTQVHFPAFQKRKSWIVENWRIVNNEASFYRRKEINQRLLMSYWYSLKARFPFFVLP
jgi:hypothetical protein